MERNSSIELYRIIATFAVLVFHFNGWLVGGMPKHFDLDHITFFSMFQAIVESCSCICVNMFLVISGYFGLRLKWQSILRICLLLFSILVPFYLIDCSFFNTTFTLKDFIGKFLVISNGGYFIQCYFMLMFLSPILNAFIEKYDRRKGAFFVLMFVMVEFWFDCITHTDYMGFRYGYSVLHFVVVYMVARYIYLYRDNLLKIKRTYWISAYILCSFIILLMYICGINFIWQYSNPVIIISAVCSIMPFLYKTYVNKWINWVAKSTLAVYIIHVSVPVYNLLVEYDTYILEHYHYPAYLALAIIGIIVVFTASILYDKARSFLTDPFYKGVTSLVRQKLYGKESS